MRVNNTPGPSSPNPIDAISQHFLKLRELLWLGPPEMWIENENSVDKTKSIPPAVAQEIAPKQTNTLSGFGLFSSWNAAPMIIAARLQTMISVQKLNCGFDFRGVLIRKY